MKQKFDAALHEAIFSEYFSRDLDAAVRRYFRQRVFIAGSENIDHAQACVRTFVEASMIDELHRLADRTIVAEAKFLATGE